MYENVRQALELLTPREREFILKKFGFYGKEYSLQSIADQPL